MNEQQQLEIRDPARDAIVLILQVAEKHRIPKPNAAVVLFVRLAEIANLVPSPLAQNLLLTYSQWADIVKRVLCDIEPDYMAAKCDRKTGCQLLGSWLEKRLEGRFRFVSEYPKDTREATIVHLLLQNDDLQPRDFDTLIGAFLAVFHLPSPPF